MNGPGRAAAWLAGAALVLAAGRAGAALSPGGAAGQGEFQGVVQSVDTTPGARSITLRTLSGSRTLNLGGNATPITDALGQPTTLDALIPGVEVQVRYAAQLADGREVDWITGVQRVTPPAPPDQVNASPEVTPPP